MLKNPRRILIDWCREQKQCPFTGRFCDSKSCSSVYMGKVILCSRYDGNPNGFLTRKRRVFV